MAVRTIDLLEHEQLVVLRAPARSALRDPNSGPVAMSAAAPGDIKIDVESRVGKADLAALAGDPTVVGFCPSMPMKLVEPVEDPVRVKQKGAGVTWGVGAVGASASPYDGSGVTVAVLDTGIDSAHSAFRGVELVSKDFTGGGSAADKHGHGTHCAGTIFGRNIDGLRIGVATGVSRAVIGKVLGPTGGGSEMLAQAILWARDSGAQVISMSLGFDFPGYVHDLVDRGGLSIEVATSMALQDYTANVRLFEKLSEFMNAGIGQPMIIAASGNESGRSATPPFEINVAPPAAAAGVISVGALGHGFGGYAVAPFSNTRPTVSAPGVGVISAALGGGTVPMSGTSMATPHAAGVAALWAQKLAAQGQLSALMLQSKLIGEATLAGVASGFDPLDLGAGLVRAPQS